MWKHNVGNKINKLLAKVIFFLRKIDNIVGDKCWKVIILAVREISIYRRTNVHHFTLPVTKQYLILLQISEDPLTTTPIHDQVEGIFQGKGGGVVAWISRLLLKMEVCFFLLRFLWSMRIYSINNLSVSLSARLQKA